MDRFEGADTAAFSIHHQGSEQFGAEAEHLGVLAIFKGIWHYKGLMKGPQEVADGILGTAWVGSFRHFPTTGVCDQRLGSFHRLLPTAGVCNQLLDFFLPQVYATIF